jgi:hypothetical protein
MAKIASTNDLTNLPGKLEKAPRLEKALLALEVGTDVVLPEDVGVVAGGLVSVGGLPGPFFFASPESRFCKSDGRFPRSLTNSAQRGSTS